MATIESLREYAQNPNVRRFLDVIAKAEGTTGYDTAFGGGTIADLSDHPRTLHDFTQTDGKRNKTSAAGRYQFLRGTWDDVAGKLGLTDFGPESQDLAAIELLRRNGSLESLLAGDFDTAIKRSGATWASLPSSPYPQPKRSGGFIANALNTAAESIFPAAQAMEPPAQNNSVTPWKEVISKPEYQQLSTEDKRKAQEQYFNQVIAPRAPKDQIDAVRSQFFEQYPVEEPPVPAGADNPLVAFGAGLGHGVGQVAMGAQEWMGRGLDAIGLDSAGEWLVNDARQGRERMGQEVAPYQAQSPIATTTGRIGGNIAGTWPVGGVLGAGVNAVSQAPRAVQLANALRSGGMNLGGAAASTVGGHAANLGIRAAGGAATGGVTAGLVNPDDAGTGAMIGAAFPIAGQAVASSARALGRGLRGGPVSSDVAALAGRAKQLGINIPADRIANSKPMNAVASSLEYVPLSGRTGTLDKMQSQFNRAVSRTFGQDSDNVTKALRDAAVSLGDDFDRVLRSTAVKVDDQLIDDLAQAAQRAGSELESGQARIITNQIDEILNKAQNGFIDGQAAYNIKRTLDRIGKRNSPEGFYADELRKTLMDALNRSLGPDDAQSFARLREQYGNMLTLRRFAQNGIDGDVSIARIANMRDIRSPQLQELADIAAQFLKPREGAHGAAQRVYGAALGGAAGYFGGPAALAAGLSAGRIGNSALNSNWARNTMLGLPSNNQALAAGLRNFMPVTSKIAPVLAAQ